MTDLAALYYFPEVFCQPRDEYMAALLQDIADDVTSMRTKDNGLMQSMCAYVGKVHKPPVMRLLRTNRTMKEASW